MISKYFEIHELVPEHIFQKKGLSAWSLIDDRLIETIDALKEIFSKGTMTINNYYWSGDREWSGLRTPTSRWYSETSMHTHGKAIDAIFSNYKAEEVREYIKNHPDKFPHIKGIEENISWLHIDTRNEDKLKSFYP